jgi:hypothetical protein
MALHMGMKDLESAYGKISMRSSPFNGGIYI